MTLTTILTAVFNSFWQTAALAALVWLAMKCVRMNAATRGVIWWVVLAVSLVLPFAPRPTLAWSHPRAASALARISEPALYDEPVFTEPSAIVIIPEQPADKWPFVVVAVWALVFLYRLARIGQSYVYLIRVKRNSFRSDLQLPDTGRSARVLLSKDVESPMAVGFLNAAVIVPADLIERITSGELDRILLHESAHIARRDDWWNLLARFLGAALALHPIAWWILRQIEYEREAACDDWVVARTGEVRQYAETLLHMAELRPERLRSYRREEALASGVFGRGSRIGNRIEKLLEARRQFTASVSATRVITGCFVLCCLAAACTLAPRWVAFAKAPAFRKAVAAIEPVSIPAITAPVVQKQPVRMPVLLAQAKPQAAPPAKPENLRFEVASVRPATFPSSEYAAGFYAGDAAAGNKLCGATISISGTLVSIPRASVCQLIALAYGVQGYQIAGAPSLQQASPQGAGASGSVAAMVQNGVALADKNPKFFFDIEARAPGPNAPTKDEVSAMLRDLLADRFHLKLHHDTKEMQYDAMVAGKNGIKLTPAKEDCKPVNGFQNLKPLIVRDTHLCGKSMEDLTVAISHNVDIPVVNKTGVDGRFDYDLHVQIESPEDSHSAWLEAYRNQLGLMLETRKGPTDVLVVDHVETPSEN